MANAFGMLLGILLIVSGSSSFLDWWGRRKERQARDRAA